MADDLMLSTTALVQTRATTTELVALASRRALDPSVFEDRAPFFWMAEISSNRLDAYYTRMAASTLRNFALDAEAGVAFQNSHATWQLGFGRSLTGKFVSAGGNGVSRVEADFYTVPNLRLHDVSTDDFITGVRAGILADVSVGFHGGECLCDICGNDMFRSWDCWHIPGITYLIEQAGGIKAEVVCTATIENAHLAEVSVVYDGATPGAAIRKAQMEATNGRLNDAQVRLLEQRYRMRLPDRRVIVPGAALSQENPMPKDETTRTAEVQTPVVAPEVAPSPTESAATQRGADMAGAEDEEEEDEEEMRQVATLQTRLTSVTEERDTTRAALTEARSRIQALEAEVARLTPAAEDGRAYRDDTIADALAEGVRAFGPEFAVETYRSLLESSGLPVIKRMRDDWKAVAARTFPTQRQTVSEGDPAPADRTDRTPNAAYTA